MEWLVRHGGDELSDLLEGDHQGPVGLQPEGVAVEVDAHRAAQWARAGQFLEIRQRELLGAPGDADDVQILALRTGQQDGDQPPVVRDRGLARLIAGQQHLPARRLRAGGARRHGDGHAADLPRNRLDLRVERVGAVGGSAAGGPRAWRGHRQRGADQDSRQANAPGGNHRQTLRPDPSGQAEKLNTTDTPFSSAVRQSPVRSPTAWTASMLGGSCASNARNHAAARSYARASGTEAISATQRVDSVSVESPRSSHGLSLSLTRLRSISVLNFIGSAATIPAAIVVSMSRFSRTRCIEKSTKPCTQGAFSRFM